MCKHEQEFRENYEDPDDMYNTQSQVYISNQKEESISIQRVNHTSKETGNNWLL